jgi:Flp pilus assembly protein TadG
MSFSSGSARETCIRARRLAARLLKDGSGVAAIEFAIVVPIMLVMFFGTVEFSSAIAIKRKVTSMARTASDLTSQAAVVTNSDLTNFFAASLGIMTPYPAAPTNVTVSELYIDPSSGAARVQWSKGASIRGVGTPVTIPSGLINRDPTTNAVLPNQYLIFSEVNYRYTPAVGYVLKSFITLSDVAYTRPRQTTCVFYPSLPTPNLCPTL